MHAYLGSTAYSKFNVLYGTKLPTRGMATITNRLNATLLNQTNYTGMEVSPEMLLGANTTALNSALLAEEGGFDFSGHYMTQRMLASSFADDDGETWSSVFGNMPPATFNEMTQSQMIRYMATRSYDNPDWLASLSKLSSKGLVMEYLQQQAELNYMLAVLKDLKMQTINQKALLARVIMVGKDKALDGLADSIHIDYNPNFMDVALEAAGDEWVGGGDVGNNYENTNVVISDDLFATMKPEMANLLKQFLQEVAKGESGSGGYNAFNRHACDGRYGHNLMPQFKNNPNYIITNMTLAEFRYRTAVGAGNRKWNRGIGNACAVGAIFAGGKYQWIGAPMHDLGTKSQFRHIWNKYKDQKLTPEIQEAINFEFFVLLKRSEFKKFF